MVPAQPALLIQAVIAALTTPSELPVVAPPYDGSGCLSQNHVGQLVARVYQGGGTTGNVAQNITCQVGHLTFGAQTVGHRVD